MDPSFCLLTFYTSSSWAQKLYTDCGKSRRSFLCGVRVCDIDHWTIKLNGTFVCEYSNMAPFWMSLVLDARPYWTLLNLVAWVELFCLPLVSFVAWVLHHSQSWRLKVPLPSRLAPSACHQLVTLVCANVLKHPECSPYYLLVILVNTTLQPPVYWCSSYVVT